MLKNQSIEVIYYVVLYALNIDQIKSKCRKKYLYVQREYKIEQIE